MDLYDEEAMTHVPCDAAEIEMAQRIFDALKQLSPDAFIAGGPKAGQMRVSFDGEFNIIELARLITRS